MTDTWTIEASVYDPAVPGVVVKYYASRGFCSGPADTPANTFFDARLLQPVDITRDAFASGTTSGQSRTGYGDFRLGNSDGLLDAWLTYGVDGRAVTVRHATKMNPAYPADFTTVAICTMELAVCGLEEIRIRIRDRQYETQVPLQTAKYLGNNALPAGLEGVADDLKAKPKPVCLGTVSNVPAVCVNTSKLIFQVNDGAVAGIDGVYDQGVPLLAGPRDWTQQANPFTVGVNCVAYSPTLDRYCAVGWNGEIATSDDDGVTWTLRANGFGVSTIYSVCWGDNEFVACAAADKIGYSANGINWTNTTTGLGTFLWWITYSPALDLYVTVSNGLVLTATNPAGPWTSQAHGFGASTIYSVCWGEGHGPGKGRFVITGQGAPSIQWSADAVTWTSAVRQPFAAGDAVTGATYGAGFYLACGTAGIVATSVDGRDWTQRDAGFGTSIVRGTAYGNGWYLLLGDDGKLAYSRDCAVWTLADSSFGASAIKTACYGNELFIAVGSAMKIATSASTATNTPYANAADLEDDALAPAPGTVKVYLAGGYFRLGSSPAGLVTADVTQGVAAANRTAAQLANLVLARAIAGASFNAGDVAALDTADASVLGHWQGLEETTCAAVLDLIANTVGAWWSCDQLGAFRIKRLIAPAGAAAVTFVASDVVAGSLQRLATLDEGNGLPVYRNTVRWGRVYAVQDTDLAAGVTDARRGVVGREWREAIYTDATVQVANPLAIATLEDSLFTTAADALTEATRRQVLRGVRRDRYELTVELNTETAALDLGDVVALDYERYGLAGGMRFTILGVAPDAMARRVRLSLWGPYWERFLVTDTGSYLVSDTGLYLFTQEE